MSGSPAPASELSWAEQVAERLLEPLGSRWRHTLGVVERARTVAGALEADKADVLVAATYVHDVGYAPELAQTGFHPLDGARFLRDAGPRASRGLGRVSLEGGRGGG